MKKYAMNLQLFADEGAAAAPAGGGAETGTAAETGTEAGEIRVGDTLGDGSQVTDARVAAALNRQMNRHPELRKVYGQGRQQEAPQQAQMTGAGAEAQEGIQPEDIQARWEAAKKGEFKDLYGQDVQRAIQDRFKNQNDANQQLTAMQPMLNALMKKAGVNSVQELQQIILDDDSLYEEEAEEKGMPVEAYKEYKRLQEEHDEAVAKLNKAEENARFRQHFNGLLEQSEALKAKFPDFDLFKEMENPQFRAMTGPDMGMTVEQAYYAMHGQELVPQLMAYGMDRAQKQMGQTLQAQRSRPMEGAMNGRNQAAAEPKLNPANMQRDERNKLKEWIRLHGPVSFDGGGPR